ncbi:unnamed protein product [Symbiodinium necroappetens]|uniref:Uncharacterized protein n=1 Tax=Symbiodinium necroappetens TaxID=1628268 RepID=A0A812P1E1_9DINO|nr:unnamed protein product [Symbiodinium necroappetens]
MTANCEDSKEKEAKAKTSIVSHSLAVQERKDSRGLTLEEQKGIKLLNGAPPQGGPADPDAVGLETCLAAVYCTGESPQEGLDIFKYLLQFRSVRKRRDRSISQPCRLVSWRPATPTDPFGKKPEGWIYQQLREAKSTWEQEANGSEYVRSLIPENALLSPPVYRDDVPAAKPHPKRVTTAQLADQLGSISQLLPTITSQLKDISEKQRALEAKVESRPAEPALAPHRKLFVFPTAKAGIGASGAGALASQVGPPPVTRPPKATAPVLAEDGPLQDALELGDPTAGGLGEGLATAALTQQTQALIQLVAHLIQSSDGGADFGGSQGAPGLSSKGSAKRERLLAELAERNGSFMLAVAQRGFRRVHLGQYLERYGGYGAERELGLTMHMTTQIADVLLFGETDALDLLALMMTCLEQVCQDGGKWEVGLRAWAPLCPAPWATTALSFACTTFWRHVLIPRFFACMTFWRHFIIPQLAQLRLDEPALGLVTPPRRLLLGEVSDSLTALGFSSDKYGPSFPGLLKLSGRANWDPSDYLDDLFYLPFRVPDLSRESAVKVYDLARRWDSFGLLRLACSGPSPRQEFSISVTDPTSTTNWRRGEPSKKLFACFSAVLQGDALGVEVTVRGAILFHMEPPRSVADELIVAATLSGNRAEPHQQRDHFASLELYLKGLVAEAPPSLPLPLPPALGTSVEYDPSSVRVFEWAAFLVEAWQDLCKKREVQVDQLSLGSPGGGTLFLSVGFPPFELLSQSWRRDLLVQPPEPGLGEAVWLEAAAAFDFSLCLRSQALASCRLDTEGLETPLVNDLALSSKWTTLRVWNWPGSVHINILECSCVYRLPVAQVLRRIFAVGLAFGLYPSAEIPDPLPGRLGHLVGYGALLPLTRIVPSRRWASNWLRLFFGLTGYRPLGAGEAYRYQGRSFRAFVPCPLSFCSFGLVPSYLDFVWPPRPSSPPLVDFDSSLGFPGEGPQADRNGFPRPFRPPLVDFDSSLGFPGEGPLYQSKCAFPLRFFVLLCLQGVQGPVPLAASHGLLLPRSARDRQRQERRGTGDLPAGRPVETVTQKNREALWASFCEWLATAGIERGLFETVEGQQDIDGINAILGRYGRELYRAGRPYAHYSETLNAFSSRVPKLRRLLQPAWDVAFAWRREEPSLHHAAMPWQVLVSLVATALLWGWVKVAGALALAWGGLLRIGEVPGALRSDLLLFSAARHQAVRVDQPNLLAVLELVYQKVPSGCKLWPFSGQTLRSRFQQLCSALQLPIGRSPGKNGLELSSLRAGGATWLMNTVEDSEFVRRRGRWLSHRIMEIYIQEVTSLQFLPTLPAPAREKVFLALETFPVILDRVVFFASVGILPTVWYKLLAADSFTMTDGRTAGGRLRNAVAAQHGRHVNFPFARQKGKE